MKRPSICQHHYPNPASLMKKKSSCRKPWDKHFSRLRPCVEAVILIDSMQRMEMVCFWRQCFVLFWTIRSLIKMQTHAADNTTPPQRRRRRMLSAGLSTTDKQPSAWMAFKGKPFVCILKVFRRWGNDIYLSVSSYGSSPAAACWCSDGDRRQKYISADAKHAHWCQSSQLLN